MKLLAASLGNISGEGLGPFGANPATSGTAALTQITHAVSSIIGFMTIAGSIWFMFQLLFGGYEWISSAGDTKKLTSARQRIMNAFFGLIIVIAAWIIVAVVGQFLGYDILISNPGTIITNLKLQ
jgi:nitrate reductase NapE component